MQTLNSTWKKCLSSPRRKLTAQGAALRSSKPSVIPLSYPCAFTSCFEPTMTEKVATDGLIDWHKCHLYYRSEQIRSQDGVSCHVRTLRQYYQSKKSFARLTPGGKSTTLIINEKGRRKERKKEREKKSIDRSGVENEWFLFALATPPQQQQRRRPLPV